MYIQNILISILYTLSLNFDLNLIYYNIIKHADILVVYSIIY